MGAEVPCSAEYNGKPSKGTALLETDYVLFRGGAYRVKVPFRKIISITADAERLVLVTEAGELHLNIGSAAKRWKAKIENPPTLLSKLGLKQGMKIAAENLPDDPVVKELGAAAHSGKVDLYLLGAENLEELTKIAAVTKRITDDGGLWIVYPKGQKHIREIDVISAGRAAGLKDVKVASFSPTHTALKFVLPVADRRK